MKLLPLEISALVGQEIRRVLAAAHRMTEHHEQIEQELVKRVEWKIEHAMRSLDAGEYLPTAYQMMRQIWPQMKLQAVRAS